MAELTLGSPAPDFALPDENGRMVKLSALGGKCVVLFVYPQDDTETCTLEAKSFSERAAKFRRAGIALFGLSPDEGAKHLKFKAKHALAVPLLSDPSLETIRAYGCWGEKELFGRRYMGVIRSTFVIDRAGHIAALWRNVRIAGHADAVLAAAKVA